MGYDLGKLYREKIEYNERIGQDLATDYNNDIPYNPMPTPVIPSQPINPHQITTNDLGPLPIFWANHQA